MKLQKKLAGRVLGCSPNRIWVDPLRIAEAKEAITTSDVKHLLNSGVIKKKPMNVTSQGQARHLQRQKAKGRRRGVGSRKGKASARQDEKGSWIKRVRAQRELLRNLRTKGWLDVAAYRALYLKSKGGFFRSVRHLKIYIDEQKLLNK